MSFRSVEFTEHLQRTNQYLISTAAEAPQQHGVIENFHRTFRRAMLAAWKHTDAACSLGDMADLIINERNDTTKVKSVSPSVLVFGHIP